MNMQMHDEDLYKGQRDGLERMESVGDQNPSFDIGKEDEAIVIDDREMWMDRDPEDLLATVDDASIFYGDFPALPDFSCMSSSSSSSPTPAKMIPRSSSSSSSTSSPPPWTNQSQDDQYGQVGIPGLMSTDSVEIPSFDHEFDSIDIVEELGSIDLFDINDIWDSSFVFPGEEDQQEQLQIEQQQQQEEGILQEGDEEGQEERPSEDLAMVFFEWLKSNKESISGVDLRSIKLKKSTIEAAARRLGGGKEGMKQLLKLILEWVQNHHLHKLRMKEAEAQRFQNCYPNPNPNYNCNAISPDSNPCLSPCTAWMPQRPHPPPYVPDPTVITAGFSPMLGYMDDPVFANGVPFNNINSHSYSPSPDYPMVNSPATWPSPPLPPFSLAPQYNSYREQRLPPAPVQRQAFSSFTNQYPCQLFQEPSEKLVRLGFSATKEARKKRMARHRRFLSHHHSQNHQHQHPAAEQHANCTIAGHANPGSWVFCSAAGGSGPLTCAPSADLATIQTQHHQRLINSDRRQGWKPEKNLRFLLQKVLKQSDVGNLGRIVLPKKEAETHLPELEARDGISIAMEDIGTSRIWNMRYRFWPNNKSRMYLLENTGDFVRMNGLQEGDFIVIYSDVKCDKYMIRGVKVRQPGTEREVKRPGKTHRKVHVMSSAGDGSSSSSLKKTVA